LKLRLLSRLFWRLLLINIFLLFIYLFFFEESTIMANQQLFFFRRLRVRLVLSNTCVCRLSRIRHCSGYPSESQRRTFDRSTHISNYTTIQHATPGPYYWYFSFEASYDHYKKCKKKKYVIFNRSYLTVDCNSNLNINKKVSDISYI